MNSAEKNNRVYLNGEIVSEAAFSHEVYGEGFYEMSVLVKRLSGSGYPARHHLRAADPGQTAGDRLGNQRHRAVSEL